ncbi:hypothetical protein XENOCAPTIV_026701 [Xenoophorus captivus]|uniref:Uncharacterized protein n=1 Tax=Xenoophorus captivus TaxID=1517983 RepID=A0ABV0R4Y7_9TELE
MHGSKIMIKFADDTTVIGLIKNNYQSVYRDEVDCLAVWCNKANLRRPKSSLWILERIYPSTVSQWSVCTTSNSLGPTSHMTSSEGQLTSGTTPDTQQIDCLSSCPLGYAVEVSGLKQLGSGRDFSPLLSPTCIRSPYSLPSFPTCAYCSPDCIYGHSTAHFYSYCIFYCTEFISVFTFLHHCIYHIDSKLLGIASTYL